MGDAYCDMEEDPHTPKRFVGKSRQQVLDEFKEMPLHADDPSFDLKEYIYAQRVALEATGWALPRVAVTFKDVSVCAVQKAMDTQVSTVWNSLLRPFKFLSKSITTSILTSVTGYVKNGEVLLVLGPPGAGCTTLLKTLSHRTSGVEIQGDIKYIGGDLICEPYTYLEEDDIHIPELTVEKTVRLSAECTTPLDFPDREAFLDRLVRNLLVRLGLFHVRDTVVGGALLRGVSGGEKKRVSIAEVLASRRPVILLDGWSKGLDSAVSLNIVKSLKLLSQEMKVAVIVSQYQLSPNMMEYFDNVLVLDQGRQLYFGTPDRAVPYFTEQGVPCPPRRTLPDFLCTLGMDNDTEELADKFKESQDCKNMLTTIDEGITVPQQNDSIAAAKDAYGQRLRVPYFYQMKLLFQRELSLFNFHTDLRPRISRSIMMGLLCGALFYDLGKGANGAYARAGLIYFILLFLGLGSFSYIGTIILQRTVVYKHSFLGFYHPVMWLLVKILVDLPLLMLEVILAISPAYYLAGLHNGVGNFVFFWINAVATAFTCGAFMKFVACVSRNLTTAQGLTALVIMFYVFFCGFLIPRDSIPKGWLWMYWANPITYSFRGVILNEYYPIQFACKSSEMIPPAELLMKLGVSNSSLSSYQLCPIPGLPTGPRYGEQYARAMYDLEFDDPDVKWGLMAVVWGFGFLYCALSFLALAYLRFESAVGRMVFAKKYKKKTNLNEPIEIDNTTHRPVPTYLVWKDMSYSVIKSGGKGKSREEVNRLELLSKVTGYCKPGMLIALMGSSGAGKTTLMDVLARRKTGGEISGSILINGVPQNELFYRISGYVEQEDLHDPQQTVREALEFSAALRLEDQTQRNRLVEETLDILGLKEIQHAVIGSDLLGFGLSAEARKRVTIGVELVANPSVLFMDEPTSGLDTSGALAVLRAARRIADSGRTVLCTVHQPSAELFEMFDHLLLLARGGKTVYFGPLGENSNTMIRYFTTNGAKDCPEHENPAEYMLDVINNPAQTNDWHKLWLQSTEFQSLKTEFSEKRVVPADVQVVCHKDAFASSEGTQLIQLLGRTFKTYLRSPNYNLLRMILAALSALLIGSSYLQLSNGQKALRGFVSVIFFSNIIGIIGALNAMPVVMLQRAIYARETASGTYRKIIYAFVTGAVELPFVMVATIIFVNIMYWMVGMNPDGDRYGFFIFATFVFNRFTVAFGQVMSVFAPTLEVAQTILPAIFGLWNNFTGFLVTKRQIPNFMLTIHIINPFSYYMSSTVSNQLQGLDFTCSPSEILLFPAPPLGCPVKGNLLGYANTNKTMCALCPYVTGEQFLDFYDFNFEYRWRDLGFLIIFTGVFMIAAFLGLMFKRQVKR